MGIGVKPVTPSFFNASQRKYLLPLSFWGNVERTIFKFAFAFQMFFPWFKSTKGGLPEPGILSSNPILHNSSILN